MAASTFAVFDHKPKGFQHRDNILTHRESNYYEILNQTGLKHLNSKNITNINNIIIPNRIDDRNYNQDIWDYINHQIEHPPNNRPYGVITQCDQYIKRREPLPNAQWIDEQFQCKSSLSNSSTLHISSMNGWSQIQWKSITTKTNKFHTQQQYNYYFSESKQLTNKVSQIYTKLNNNYGNDQLLRELGKSAIQAISLFTNYCLSGGTQTFYYCQNGKDTLQDVKLSSVIVENFPKERGITSVIRNDILQPSDEDLQNNAKYGTAIHQEGITSCQDIVNGALCGVNIHRENGGMAYINLLHAIIKPEQALKLWIFIQDETGKYRQFISSMAGHEYPNSCFHEKSVFVTIDGLCKLNKKYPEIIMEFVFQKPGDIVYGRGDTLHTVLSLGDAQRATACNIAADYPSAWSRFVQSISEEKDYQRNVIGKNIKCSNKHSHEFLTKGADLFCKDFIDHDCLHKINNYHMDRERRFQRSGEDLSNPTYPNLPLLINRKSGNKNNTDNNNKKRIFSEISNDSSTSSSTTDVTDNVRKRRKISNVDSGKKKVRRIKLTHKAWKNHHHLNNNNNNNNVVNSSLPQQTQNDDEGTDSDLEILNETPSSSSNKTKQRNKKRFLPRSFSSFSTNKTNQRNNDPQSVSDEEYFPLSFDEEEEVDNEAQYYPSSSQEKNKNIKHRKSSSNKKKKHSSPRTPNEILSEEIEGSQNRMCLLTGKEMVYEGTKVLYGKTNTMYRCTMGCKQKIYAFKWNDHVRRCGKGHKPYKCKWPGCHEAFARNAYLKQHMDAHQQVKYKCGYCSVQFSRPSKTKQHIQDAHPGKSTKKINKIVTKTLENEDLQLNNLHNNNYEENRDMIDNNRQQIQEYNMMELNKEDSSSEQCLLAGHWIFLSDERLYAQLLHLDTSSNEWVANLYKYDYSQKNAKKKRYQLFTKNAKIELHNIENNYMICAESEISLILQQTGTTN